MQSNEPSQSVQPILGDHRAWPSRPSTTHIPYGLSLNAGELLTRTWSVWQADALRLTGITAIPYVLMAVVGAVAGSLAVASGIDIDIEHLEDSGPVIGLAIGGGVGLCISIVLSFIAAQAGTFLVVEERLRGEARGISVVGAILSGLSALLPMMGAWLVVGAVVCVALVPAAMVGIAAVSMDSWALGGAAALLLFPVGIAGFVASLRLFAIGPVVVTEDVGPIASIRRSLELTRGKLGDVFVAFLVFGAVMFAVNLVTGILGLIPIVGMLVQLAVGIVVGSLQSVYVYLVYGALRDQQG
jgi:hypothetical protein